MAVNEGNRGPTKMKVHTLANDLAIYTIKICTNKKIFLPEYQSALTDDLIRTAKDIFIYAWDANNIWVTSTELFQERRQLQLLAIRKCRELLAMMQIAQRLFHLKTKRIKYWGGLTNEVKELLKKWSEADKERYEAKGY